ncbi:MAG: hypothetical protein R3A13_08500 [Bdellovibrionota bacterium]
MFANPEFNQRGAIFPDSYSDLRAKVWDPVSKAPLDVDELGISLPPASELEKSPAGQLCAKLLKDANHTPSKQNILRLVDLYAQHDYNIPPSSGTNAKIVGHNLSIYYDRGMIVGTLRELASKHSKVVNQLLGIASSKGEDSVALLRTECAVLGISRIIGTPTRLTDFQAETLATLLDGRELTDRTYFYVVSALKDKEVPLSLPFLIRHCADFNLQRTEDNWFVNRWDTTDGMYYANNVSLRCFKEKDWGFEAIIEALKSEEKSIKAGVAYLLDTFLAMRSIYYPKVDDFFDRLTPEVAPALLELLEEDNIELKAAALYGLMSLGRRADVDPDIILSLFSHSAIEIRTLSLKALGVICGPLEKVIEKYRSLFELFMEIQQPEKPLITDPENQEFDGTFFDSGVKVTSSEIRPEAVYLLHGLAAIVDNETAKRLFAVALTHEEVIVRDAACEALENVLSIEAALDLLNFALNPAKVQVPQTESPFYSEVYSRPFRDLAVRYKNSPRELTQQALAGFEEYILQIDRNLEFVEGKKAELLREIRRAVEKELVLFLPLGEGG